MHVEVHKEEEFISMWLELSAEKVSSLNLLVQQGFGE